MPSATDVILNIVCPLLGTITAYAMFCAPLPAVQLALSRGSMNDLNPLPWAFLMGNCLGWTLYSVLTQNIWLLVANAPGFLIAVWFNLAASKLQYQMQFQVLPTIASKETALLATIHEGEEEGDLDLEMQQQKSAAQKLLADEMNGVGGDVETEPPSDSDDDSSTNTVLEPGQTVRYKIPTHDYWVMGITIGWVVILAMLGFAQSWSMDIKQNIVGIITNFNLLFFYAAPLSTIASILKTRNTASIHVPTMMMNTVNSGFWTVYGFAIFDFFVFVPNGIGACLGLVQVFLYMTFPRQTDDTPNTIAATIVVGDTAADAVVMGDPTSQDAVIMMNKEDVERLQHSIAVDEKLGGIQVVTSGVPAFDPIVEPALMLDEQMQRRNQQRHRRSVTFSGAVTGYEPPPATEATSFNSNSAVGGGGGGGGMDTSNNNSGGGGGGVDYNSTSVRGSTRHMRSLSAGEVPLINLSRHRRKASKSDVPLDLLDMDYNTFGIAGGGMTMNPSENNSHPDSTSNSNTTNANDNSN